MMHLYSADRARPLAARLSELLSSDPPDPMDSEWLAVPSDGMRRWLTLELAHSLGHSGSGAGDGVAANFTRAYPGTLRSTALASDLEDPEADPWSIDRLVWSVLEVAEDQRHDPVLMPYFSVTPGASRYAKARRVADLFDRYHLHRPGMVRAWADGDDIDGSGWPVSASASWQPYLWRRVRAAISVPSPPEQMPGILDRLRQGTVPLDLPARLVLFGFALLPGAGFLDLAHAVAEHREVHLFLLQPTEHHSSLVLGSVPRPSMTGPRLRSADLTSELVGQPLLRSWGRLHRETAVLLADARSDGVPDPEWVGTPAQPPDSLLGRLQHHVRTDVEPDGGDLPPHDPDDQSVQFHACYGATRQAEVLRDAILHLLDEPGSDLCEDDIVVVCPSLDRFAPLVEAAFGPSVDPLGPSHSSGDPSMPASTPGLRYRIADQSIRSANPVLSAAAALLDLVAGRFSVASVLDFLGLVPVRERFRLDDDALSDMARWVTDTNVRWGLDAAHRTTFGLPQSLPANTWRAALDRLLIGSTVQDDEWSLTVGGVAPYGVEGLSTERVGQLSEILWHLGNLAEETTHTHPVDVWVQRIRQVSDRLFSSDRDSRWQIEALQRVFDEVIQSATSGDSVSGVPLTFVDVRRLFEERLRSLPGRPDYFRGGVTVTSMTPLRWVPFRVVCLLGMDQSAFGTVTAPGDDLIAVHPQLGDPDPRAEARQSILEAVLSAGDQLIVVRDGHDVRSNQAVPRAVVVAELFDAVTALVHPDHRKALADQLEIDHPRQAFDERYFTDNGLGPNGPWGFDRSSLEGARARRHRSSRRPPFLADPLDDGQPVTIELDDLHRFFRNPAGAFLTQRLEARLPLPEEEPTGVLPVELDPLERWQVATRLLSARMDGITADAWEQSEQARGTLPPGSLGRQMIDELGDEIDVLVAAARSAGVTAGRPEPFPVGVDLPGGVHLVGSVLLRLGGAHRGPAHVSYSKLRPRYRVAAWLDLMALAATDPSQPWRSVAIGRPPKPGKPAEVYDIVPAVGSAASVSTDGLLTAGLPGTLVAARQALSVAVDCYRRGMREPIPLFPTLSFDLHNGKGKATTWRSSSPGYGGADGDDPAVALAFEGIGYADLLELPARPGDPPGSGGRVSRFADYLHGTIRDTTHQFEPEPAPASAASGAG